MEIFILIATGLSVGLVSSFFGIGGGSIMIPVLYILFPKLPPAAIISTSLGAIALSASLNTHRFYKAGLTPKKQIGVALFLATGLGALIGSQFVYILPAALLKKIFGGVLLVLSIQVFLKKNSSGNTDQHEGKSLILKVVCFVGGFISSVTGLGGGAVFVPFFISLVKLPMKLISPYSNIAMVAAAVTGLAPHFFKAGEFSLKSELAQKAFIGHVNILFILCLFSGAFVTSKFGVKLNSKVDESLKKLLLSILLFGLGLKILVG
ncbi:MAG: sulfite exporter TauE/SafE family protein [Bacteriovoracaceae bacterium]|nr:sulfite exporter TauE/SafE family protein [Bacteriovoracaceae bacterium]